MMNNNLRALFGMSALAFLLTAAPVLASEVSFTSENVKTGAESDNTGTQTLNENGDVTVTNDGNVDNTAKADVETGDNEQNMNTSGGSLDSGSVDASTDWSSMINTDVCQCLVGNQDVTVDGDGSNDTTGYKSDNTNKQEVNLNGDTTLTNVANVLNSLYLKADTGDNEQNYNTMAGNLSSGDVMVDATISNEANTGGSASGASAGSTSVSFAGSNHLTGAESDNSNTQKVNQNGDVRVTNVAKIDNKIKVKADTGHNEQNKNTTAGDLSSGGVSVSTDISNVANTGSCNCVGSHDTSVSADFSNDTTGYKSDNDNKQTVNENGDTTVTNTADVDNTLDVNANTGDNEQEKNTEGGDVQSGDVSINFNVSNSVNSN